MPSAEEKVKSKKKHESEGAAKFPVDARVNPYSFIFLKAKWLAALGWHVDMPLSIDKNADGSVTIRKA